MRKRKTISRFDIMVRKRINKLKRFGPDRSCDEERMKALAKVADRFEGWEPARKVLTPVKAVKTIFPQINLGTRVGGWPLQRVSLVHGPSAHGKTIFCHGLGLSFLRAGHFYGFIDAEYTTPEDWLVELMGDEMSSMPTFVAMRPKTYEKTVDAVKSMLENIKRAVFNKEIDSNTSAIIVVDSIKKLIPSDLIEKIEKHGADGKKGSIDGRSGRGSMYQAALNSAWLKQLIPMLYHTCTTMVFIARESENVDRCSPFDPAWKVTGGKDLIFDSSMTIRVTHGGMIKLGDKTIGEKHLATIHKSKVGGKAEKTVQCHFYTSNGESMPAGFDRARDVVDLGIRLGFIVKKGRSLVCEVTGEVWASENVAVKQLNDSPSSLDILEEYITKDFDVDKIEVSDEDIVDG